MLTEVSKLDFIMKKKPDILLINRKQKVVFLTIDVTTR